MSRRELKCKKNTICPLPLQAGASLTSACKTARSHIVKPSAAGAVHAPHSSSVSSMGSSSPRRARLAAEMGASSSGSRGSCAITGCSDGCAWAHLREQPCPRFVLVCCRTCSISELGSKQLASPAITSGYKQDCRKISLLPPCHALMIIHDITLEQGESGRSHAEGEDRSGGGRHRQLVNCARQLQPFASAGVP